MRTVCAKVTAEQEQYLEEIVRQGIAKSESDAIRLIIAERMLKDSKDGKIGPFTVEVERPPRKPRTKKIKATFKELGDHSENGAPRSGSSGAGNYFKTGGASSSGLTSEDLETVPEELRRYMKED